MEFLYRRVDVQDVVDAHLLALEKACSLRFGRYIISATTPFTKDDLSLLRTDVSKAVARYVPESQDTFRTLGWKMPVSIDRVYINEKARTDLGWDPKYTFARFIACKRKNEDPRSPLACAIGAKGYHSDIFTEGPYPVERG